MLQDPGRHHGVLGGEFGDEGRGGVAAHVRRYRLVKMLLGHLRDARVDAHRRKKPVGRVRLAVPVPLGFYLSSRKR
jgi:hypothetical protein